jgi:small subunit ribosomal protein S16
MSVKIRLMRVGRKKVDQYRVVVADIRSPRDGRFIERIGYYHPQNEPSNVNIDEERALYWLSKGATPTQKVRSLLKEKGILAKFRESTASQKG